MGVRGLTTYIAKNSDRYLESYELKCCTIIIDGNNIACQLYNWVAKCNSAFGGDYDKYANCVKEFFTLLLKCEVKPLVIFDGGYETKKLPTVRERLKKKLQSAKAVNPVTHSNLAIFPLFMKDVFMDVLRSLNISFAQSDFEADSEIAAIARQLKCPVLSYDSDFYVFDVLYIPFSSVILEPVKYVASTDKRVKYYVSCKIYKIETFLNSLGGLDKALLPVLAVVLGNDYIEKQVLQNFLSQIKCPKYRSLNPTQRQIVGILDWLRNETLDTAVAKILSHLKKHKRPAVSQQLSDIISGYKSSASSLLTYLSTLEDASTSQLCKTEPEVQEELIKEETEKEIQEDEGGEIEKKEEQNERDYNTPPSTHLKSHDNISRSENELFKELCPEWFIQSFRQGDLPPSFVNMLVLKTHFFAPQVEKFSSLFSHHISLPILSAIFGILTSEFPDTASLELNCVTYMKGLQIKNLPLLPLYKNALPSLSNIPSLPVNVRQSLLYDIVEFTSCDVQILNNFPSNWKIIILSMVYWTRNVSEPFVNIYHIYALLFSITMLNVVGNHVGYCRSKKAFMKVYASQLKKLNVSGTSLQQEFCCSDSLIEAIAAVTEKDCLSAFDNTLPFHAMDETLKNRPKLFDLEVVHTFAQFQSCAYFINHLNALLSYPFPGCQIARFYSGTLIYNAYMNFKKRSNVGNYICRHLFNTSSLGMLYEVLLNTVACFLPNLFKVDGQKKTNKRKKKKKPKESVSVSESVPTDEESETDEVEEFMKNNRFSALSFANRN